MGLFILDIVTAMQLAEKVITIRHEVSLLYRYKYVLGK